PGVDRGQDEIQIFEHDEEEGRDGDGGDQRNSLRPPLKQEGSTEGPADRNDERAENGDAGNTVEDERRKDEHPKAPTHRYGVKSDKSGGQKDEEEFQGVEIQDSLDREKRGRQAKTAMSDRSWEINNRSRWRLPYRHAPGQRTCIVHAR